VNEGGTALVHHLGLPLRIEILRYDTDDPQKLALPRLEHEAVLFQKIKQVLLRQVELLLAFLRIPFDITGILVAPGSRQGTPKIAEGALLMFQPVTDALAFGLNREPWRAAVAEHALVHEGMGRVEDRL